MLVVIVFRMEELKYRFGKFFLYVWLVIFGFGDLNKLVIYYGIFVLC